MYCEQVQELLALWVGGDLEGNDAQAIEGHLKGCRDCQGLAAAWRRDMDAVNGALGAGTEPGPDEEALEAAVAVALARRTGMFGRRNWQPGRLLAGVAALLVFMLVGHFMATDLVVVEQPLTEVADTSIAWTDLQDFFDDCLTRPVPVDQWQGEAEGGVLAILVRTEDRDRYEVAASLEVADLARVRSYPWLAQRLHKLQMEAGVERELVLTSCGTGRLDRATRRRLEREFRAEFAIAGVN